MAPHQYRPLLEQNYTSSTFPVRLVLLHSGTFENIKLEIVQEILCGDTAPQFESLSYVWGSTEKEIEVEVHSRDHHEESPRIESIFVTQNLAIALRYLRHPDKPRMLWIDAICINQRDDSEKSLQVMRMAEIYRRATRVVIWLGPEQGRNALGLEILERLGSQVQVDWDKYTVQSPRYHGRTQSPEVEMGPDSLSAVVSVLCSTWFERLWVQQEVSSATNGVIMSGQKCALWSEVRKGLFYLVSSSIVNGSSDGDADLFNKMHVRCITRYRKITTLWRRCAHSSSLFHFINGFRELECADPRDKIYALLAMGEESPALRAIKPDYNLPLTEIYVDLVHQYNMAGCDDTSFLEFCESPSKLPGLPSWVPDLTMMHHGLHPKSIVSDLRGPLHLSHNILHCIDIYSTKVTSVTIISLDTSVIGGYIAKNSISILRNTL